MSITIGVWDVAVIIAYLVGIVGLGCWAGWRQRRLPWSESKDYFLAGCAAPQPKRYAWVTGLKTEKAAYYKQLHANPRPGVNQKLKECQIQNYSIYVKEIEGKLYLFSYLEYTGKDFDKDMKRMAADPETQRWWKETDPCQQPLPDAAAKGKIWSDADELYHLP